NLFAKIIEVAIVGIEFLIVEVEAGKEFVFFKNVVGDDGLVRPRTEIKRAQLLEAANQECQLGLKGSSSLTLVKRLQKRIVRRFDDALSGQSFSENPRQRALSNAYGTFDRNVTGKLEKLGHGLSWELFRRIYCFTAGRNAGNVDRKKSLVDCRWSFAIHERRSKPVFRFGVLAND